MIILKCALCGNVVELIKDTGMPVICCGQNMTELVPGTSDGAHEKHVPIAIVNGNKVCVKVGSTEHPMTDTHYIEWIAIETSKSVHRIYLSPNQCPRADFVLIDGEHFVSAYAYCNLHELWESE